MPIGMIIAMIASAAMQAYSQNAAAKKQQQMAAQSHQRQLAAQNEATKVAAAKAEEFAPDKRNEQQADIEQALTGELTKQVDKPMITAQGVEVGTTIDGGHSDYTAAKAREKAKTAASLRSLAALMGRIGSASELRRNEAVGIGDAATDIGRIQTGANNVAGIDQFAVQTAGRPNLGLTLASAALNAYGMSGAGGMGKAPMKFPEYGMSSGPTGGWV
jgi:type II secretory pathway pseudopilin PulG